MKEEIFVTADVYLAAALSTLLNISPFYKTEKGRTVFHFEVSDDLYKAVNAFNNNIPLPALDYCQALKRVRAEMIMRRNQGERR